MISPELQARIRKIVTTILSVAVIVLNVVKPEWSAQLPGISENISQFVELFFNILAAIFLLGSSGKPSLKNIV
jgi:hypothetical protein